MGDNRYQELLKGLSSHFAAEERDVEADRAQAIQEILALMSEHGIQPEDLLDHQAA